MESLISIKNVNKHYGTTQALSDVNIEIPSGKIVGLVGPNGAGKTTLLRAMTGLIQCEGSISILNNDPYKNRPELMLNTGVIHDISVLPPWMSVSQVIRFQQDVHPQFDIKKCDKLLEKTVIKKTQKVKQLSKGMKTQLHLALVLATDSRLLILDEPTHGLDILFRKQLYASVLEDYFEHNKSIVISTHQVEEVEHILSDVIFIKDGKVLMKESMENLEKRFMQISVPEEYAEEMRKFNPLLEQSFFGKKLFLLEKVNRANIEQYGEIKTPSIADIFVAMMGGN
ncbi:MAG: ABC transporter ATP-binding protein [Candidatus Marinimicrobia bacterium]|nr:ABC transporter ATP-binding protein [Candidatus Neomarinimicrobiota bacterium]MBL7023445.1 ABC transporter ATP-binding protein [Candidatus Neomarinimicrobiota bacterium]MBL7108806.1 ABC transporter ATP-binding protein [Candidatus Neomarinimicrobiota bacterium]